MSRNVVIAIILLCLIVAGGYLLADYYRETPDMAEASYVGRSSCIDCHQEQAELFHGSDHDLAMDLATDETVLADFEDQSIEHHGQKSKMFRDGEKFMVNTEGPDGEMTDFEVKYVFGVRPLQQYMVEIERPSDAKPDEVGRVQVLRISWDTSKQKWFHLDPPDVTDKLEPDDPLHWTGITQNWNASCAACHSTDLKKNFNPLANNYHTTFSEIDVSCEACHGPGSYHVDLANRKSPFWDREQGFGLVKLKTESNLPQIETCAPCHSRRTAIANDFRPGCNFDDYFATQTVMDRVYHHDGQIRDEDYVYGSFIQSKMYHNGIKCSDCHDVHSTKVKFSDNQLCTSCHQHPAGKYDTQNHHHHEPGTPGASCVECHMPSTTYMLLDARRDHSLRVPRPDMSVSLGTPNACTGCHIDEKKLVDRKSEKPLTQYLDWIMAAEEGDDVVKAELERVDRAMLEATEKWYPAEQSPEKTKYYEQLAIGLSGREDSVPSLVGLANDPRVPNLFRASALTELRSDDGPESLAAAIKALDDPSAKVVAAALIRIDSEVGRISERFQYSSDQNANLSELKKVADAVSRKFNHPSRRVRIEAARVFTMFDPQTRLNFTTADQRGAFEKAMDELKKSLYVENDRASSHVMLGGIHEMVRDFERAKDNYRAAVTIEPNLAGPRSNLAALLEQDIRRRRSEMQQSQQQGGIQARQLETMMKQMQRDAAQVDRLRFEEHGLLAKDVERSVGLPNTHGLHFRFAMSSFIQRDMKSAEKHLLEAYQQQPTFPRYQMGLATYYLDVEQDAEAAMKYIKSLVELDPAHPGYQALMDKANGMLNQ